MTIRLYFDEDSMRHDESHGSRHTQVGWKDVTWNAARERATMRAS